MTGMLEIRTTLRLERIQTILSKIEADPGRVDIDLLIQDVEEAASLISFCKEKLFNAEAKIQKVLNSIDEDTERQS